MTIIEIQKIIDSGGMVVMDAKYWPEFQSQAVGHLTNFRCRVRIDKGRLYVAKDWPSLYPDTEEGKWHTVAYGGPTAVHHINFGTRVPISSTEETA